MLAVGHIVSRFCQRWANGGLPTSIRVRYFYILLALGQHWDNGGFLFKMAAGNNRDLEKLSTKLFIMVCLKIIFQ